MDETAIRESRTMLRQVHEHLLQAHQDLGAYRETISVVDVVHHPINPLPDFNYVTPRRNTAWVSGQYVKQGLDRLRGLERTPRVQYVEGLFPPLFAKTLLDLGLELERETPLMIYRASGADTMLPPSSSVMSAGVQIQTVADQRGIEMWWYVWRNAFYDVLTLGVEPLVVGRDMAALLMGKHADFLMMRHNFPIGVARLSVQEANKSAHVVALAMMKEARTPERMRALLAAVLRAALARGCDLVFAPGETEEDRRLCRELGFIDVSSIVCYVARAGQPANGRTEPHGTLVQPILTLR
ncbi:MAG: hypothetical protein SF162_20340 [bacterium]|nr:hypothetical protein [bacterium]